MNRRNLFSWLFALPVFSKVNLPTKPDTKAVPVAFEDMYSGSTTQEFHAIRKRNRIRLCKALRCLILENKTTPRTDANLQQLKNDVSSVLECAQVFNVVRQYHFEIDDSPWLRHTKEPFTLQVRLIWGSDFRCKGTHDILTFTDKKSLNFVLVKS